MKSYLISQVEVIDAEAWERYRELAAPAIAKFPSKEAIHDWYASPEYAAAFAYRNKAVRRRLLFVEGVEEPQDGVGIMSDEENTKVALDFLENLSTGKMEAALNLIADDVVWWLAGKPEQFQIAGTKNKAQLTEMLKAIEAGMPAGIRLTITGVTTQDNRVAVEMLADGVSATGAEYHNQYHDLFEVRDGKIHAAREYLDTAHAQEVIVGSAIASGRLKR
jgi:ketosteroid isomerase-like protein/uncharacterized protein (DUF1330 family)